MFYGVGDTQFFEQMTKQPYMVAYSYGEIGCNNEVLADPVVGYDKQCMCWTTLASDWVNKCGFWIFDEIVFMSYDELNNCQKSVWDKY